MNDAWSNDAIPGAPGLGEGEPIPLPIDGVLDLHGFRPQETKEIVMEYLRECQARGVLEVRLIHGKGIGNLRRTVQALLAKHPDVARFADASQVFGGLGATMVWLKPRSSVETGQQTST
jgi:DNA-nicking Smr family endonuclease